MREKPDLTPRPDRRPETETGALSGSVGPLMAPELGMAMHKLKSAMDSNRRPRRGRQLPSGYRPWWIEAEHDS